MLHADRSLGIYILFVALHFSHRCEEGEGLPAAVVDKTEEALARTDIILDCQEGLDAFYLAVYRYQRS